MGGERRLAGCSYSRLVLVLDAHTGSWRHLAIAGGQMLPVLKKPKTSYHNTGCLAWRWLSDTNKWFKWVFLQESHNYENSTCLLPMTASLGEGGSAKERCNIKSEPWITKFYTLLPLSSGFQSGGREGGRRKLDNVANARHGNLWESLSYVMRKFI